MFEGKVRGAQLFYTPPFNNHIFVGCKINSNEVLLLRLR